MLTFSGSPETWDLPLALYREGITMRLNRWNMVMLAALTLTALALAAWLGWSTYNYRPAYHQPQEMGPALPVLSGRVALVLIDGLPYHLATQMPCLQPLIGRAATAKSLSVLPTMSQATWTALLSGARPEISGAALFNAEYDALQPIQVDHLFALAKDAGMSTAIAGHKWWKKMIPAQFVDRSHYVAAFDAAGDLEATQAAIGFLHDPTIDLLLVYLGEYDEMSDIHGPSSQIGSEALRNTNERVCELLAEIDLGSTVLAITADHGQLPQGGHGGDDKPVRETLFLLAGPHVRPGEYQSIEQPDIALTLAALLGLPLPRSGQGRILHGLLEATPAVKMRWQAALAIQSMAQADAYLESIKAAKLPTALKDQVTKLEEALQVESLEEAERLSSTLLDQTALFLTRERAAKISRSRLTRVPIALGGLALIVLLFLDNWRRGHRAAMLLALLSAVAYQALWMARGHVFSLSTLSSPGSPVSLLVTLVGGAMAVLVLGWFLLWLPSFLRRDGTKPPLSSARAFSTGVVGILFLLGLAAFTVNGSLGSWQLVVPSLAFVVLLAWVQAALVGSLSLLGFGLVKLVQRIFRRR